MLLVFDTDYIVYNAHVFLLGPSRCEALTTEQDLEECGCQNARHMEESLWKGLNLFNITGQVAHLVKKSGIM